MEVELTNEELARLERYRQANAIPTLEEAFERLATADIHRRYRLPIRRASILPFQGLKSSGDQDG